MPSSLMQRVDLRRQAYTYIRQKLAGLPVDGASPDLFVPLDDLRLLRDGLADPSAELVATLRALLGGGIGENEIETHLVIPFETKVSDR